MWKISFSRLNRFRKIGTKPLAVAFLAVFPSAQKQLHGEVISGVDVDDVGMDVRAKFGDYNMSNRGQLNRLFERPDSFYAILRRV